MKIPFYQKTWNGIDLLEICKKIGHDSQTLLNEKFYKAYYDSLLQLRINETWRQQKYIQTQWLKERIDANGNKEKKIISIGAGTGIVESPLIQEGYDIELHDCQEESFNLLGLNEKTTCYAGPLDVLLNNRYDMIVSIAMTYALSDKQLKRFFEICKTILNPGGKLIILDAPLSWSEIYSYLRNRKVLKRQSVFWGFKRNITAFRKIFSGYKLNKLMYYDEKMRPLKVNTFMRLPYSHIPHWQMLELSIQK